MLTSFGRGTLVSGVFLGLALTVAALSVLPPLPLLVLLLGAAGCFMVWRGPVFGLAALIVGSLHVPFGLSTGTQTEINVSVVLVLLLMAIWASRLLFQPGSRYVWPRPFVPLVGFLLVSGLAFLAGIEPWMTFAQTAPIRAQIGGLAIFVLSAGLFCVVAHLVPDARSLQRLVWIFLAAGTWFVIARYVTPIGLYPLRLIPAGAVGSLLFAWLVAVALSQGLFNRQLSASWRGALLGLVALILVPMVGAETWRGWLSGWVPAVAAAGVVILIGSPRSAVALGIVGAIASIPLLPKVIDVLFGGDNAYSYSTRLEAWAITWEMIKLNPLLGLGPANYYWYALLFPIRGYAVHFNSHNNYIDITAETGLLGLAFFLWFMLEVGYLGWRLRDRAPAGFPRAYVYGALGGLAGTLVAGMLGDWVLPFPYNVGLAGFRASMVGWFFLGGLVVLYRESCSSKPPPGSDRDTSATSPRATR